MGILKFDVRDLAASIARIDAALTALMVRNTNDHNRIEAQMVRDVIDIRNRLCDLENAVALMFEEEVEMGFGEGLRDQWNNGLFESLPQKYRDIVRKTMIRKLEESK